MAEEAEKPALQLQAVAELEKRLGVPQGLFERLKEEDDWSFIIKTQALLETALTHLVTVTLGREELETFVERLNLRGGAGKLSLVKALGLLTDNHRKYLEQLAELRNKVAHKIQYVAFTLNEHLSGLNDSDLKKFVLTAVVLPGDSALTITDEFRGKILAKPRNLLWVGALDCLVAVYFHGQEAEERRLLDNFYKNFYENNSLFGQGLAGLFQNRLADLVRPGHQGGLLSGVPVEAAPTQAPSK